MKTLIIYDEQGVVFNQKSGSYRKPVGLQYIEVEIPQGKYIVSVDVGNKLPIFQDLPKSELELLREENVFLQSLIAEMYERIELSDFNKEVILAELVELLLGGK